MNPLHRSFGAFSACLALLGCAAAEGRVEHAESAPRTAPVAAAPATSEAAEVERAAPVPAEITPLTVQVALTTSERPESRRLPGGAALTPRECGADGVLALALKEGRGVTLGSSLQGARFRACPRGSQSLFDVGDGATGVPVMRGFTPHLRLDW